MTEIPFIAHLNELKLRGSYILISLLLNTVICFYFMDSVSLYLIELGKEPISFIFTGLSEIFLTYIKFSLLFGVCLTLPIGFIQLYLFFAPGLYIVEQKRLRFYLIIFLVSFYLGGWIFVHSLIPMAWSFFLDFQRESIASFDFMPRVKEYLDFCFNFILCGGFLFQLPFLIVLLFNLGLVGIENISTWRKYYIFFVLVVAGIVTPPDVISQLFVFVLTVLICESTIFMFMLSNNSNSIVIKT